MKTMTHHGWLTRLLAATALVVALAALLAGSAGAAETERSNGGWYIGLEYEDVPRPQPAAAHARFPWETSTFGFGAAVAALLLAATVRATRSRNGRTAPC